MSLLRYLLLAGRPWLVALALVELFLLVEPTAVALVTGELVGILADGGASGIGVMLAPLGGLLVAGNVLRALSLPLADRVSYQINAAVREELTGRVLALPTLDRVEDKKLQDDLTTMRGRSPWTSVQAAGPPRQCKPNQRPDAPHLHRMSARGAGRYLSEGTFIPRRGAEPLSGTDAIRGALAQFTALRPTLSPGRGREGRATQLKRNITSGSHGRAPRRPPPSFRRLSGPLIVLSVR